MIKPTLNIYCTIFHFYPRALKISNKEAIYDLTVTVTIGGGEGKAG